MNTKTTLALLFLCSSAHAQSHNPQALLDVETRVTQSLHQGNTPVVVFDLDDTLIDTRNRTLRILHQLASEKSVQGSFPSESNLLAQASEPKVRFDLSQTLVSMGVDSTVFQSEAQDFWLDHFFTNNLCENDVANPGAVAYVNQLFSLGAKIIYLTGRDEPRMGEGTRDNLRMLGFPLDENRAFILMKPTPQGSDLDFKESEFPLLRFEGDVVASFENEPMNINAFQAGFPNAVMIFLDTIHSDSPVEPNAGISWVKDFNTPNQSP